MLEAASVALALGSDKQRLSLSQASTWYSISHGVCFGMHYLEYSCGRDIAFEYQSKKSGGVSWERHLLCLLVVCLTRSLYLWNM